MNGGTHEVWQSSVGLGGARVCVDDCTDDVMRYCGERSM